MLKEDPLHLCVCASECVFVCECMCVYMCVCVWIWIEKPTDVKPRSTHYLLACLLALKAIDTWRKSSCKFPALLFIFIGCSSESNRKRETYWFVGVLKSIGNSEFFPSSKSYSSVALSRWNKFRSFCLFIIFSLKLKQTGIFNKLLNSYILFVYFQRFEACRFFLNPKHCDSKHFQFLSV